MFLNFFQTNIVIPPCKFLNSKNTINLMSSCLFQIKRLGANSLDNCISFSNERKKLQHYRQFLFRVIHSLTKTSNLNEPQNNGNTIKELEQASIHRMCYWHFRILLFVRYFPGKNNQGKIWRG